MNHIKTLIALIILIHLVSCGENTSTKTEEVIHVSTPVTTITIENAPISEVISFNAVSIYQRKNIVKSIITGYIDNSFVNQGDIVKVGKPLYSIKTKEGDALSKFAPKDSALAFKGNLTIVSPTSGVVLEATKQINDYVSDGEQLCVLAVQNSFVFMLNVPFEQNKYAVIGKKCKIILPDSTFLDGTISSKLSTVDLVSQTQSFIVKPSASAILPENLSVQIQINKCSKENTQVIDKVCILSDETMEKFWVMKLINDSMAVKTIIKVGISARNKVEILSPTFFPNDRIIKNGNYGLADTAFVTIIQH